MIDLDHAHESVPSSYCGRVDHHDAPHDWTTPTRRARGLPMLTCPGAPTVGRAERTAIDANALAARR